MLDDVYVQMRQQCRELAYEMVMLEEWAREAHRRRQWVRVGELHGQREKVQSHRSRLMREIWEEEAFERRQRARLQAYSHYVRAGVHAGD
jgi:hypothetical protein